MDTIQGLFMMNAGRGYIQTKSRFWEDEGIGGLKIAKTDTAGRAHLGPQRRAGPEAPRRA
jgi:monoamine oxidase